MKHGRFIDLPARWQAWLGIAIVAVLGIAAFETLGLFNPIMNVAGKVLGTVRNFFSRLFGGMAGATRAKAA